MSLVNALDPMQLLAAKAAQQAAPGAASPSAPAAAQAPVPGPSPAGGGFFSGIGTRISNAMNGDGFFGTPDAAADAEIDPATGLPKAISRRANNQAIMKMGLLLMAAGQRQSDDSRARILSGVASAADTSETINNFAQNRLQMAKIKLLEREQLQSAAAASAINAQYGVGGAPMATVPDGTPIGVGGGNPGSSLTPVGGPAPAGVDATAPVVAPSGVDPAGAPVASAAAAPADGAPPMPAAIPAASLSTTAPAPPPVPRYVPTPDERVAISTMTRRGSEGVQEATKYIAQRTKEIADTELKGEPYLKPGVGVVQDTFKGGNKTGTSYIGKPTDSIVPVPQPDGSTLYKTIDAAGNLTDVKEIRDPISDDATKGDRQFFQARSVELDKSFKDVRKDEKTYDKLVDLRAKVLDGKAITGAGADARRAGLNFMASLGWVQPGQIEKLVNSSDIERQLANAAGQFAKENYGPQISNADVENANKLMGALLSNDKAVVAAAMDQIISQKRSAIENYNEDASLHNERIPEGMKRVYGARTIDRKFEDLPSVTAPAQAEAPAQAAVSAAPATAEKPKLSAENPGAINEAYGRENRSKLPDGVNPGKWGDMDPNMWDFMTPEQQALFK